MIGKKGIVRILEAFIAIMIISGAMGFIYVTQVQRPNQDVAIHELQRIILEEISSNVTLRKEIVETDIPGNYPKTNITISNLISSEFNYEFKVCELNKLCKIDTIQGIEVFSEEITISSTLEEYAPKVIRLFIWEK